MAIFIFIFFKIYGILLPASLCQKSFNEKDVSVDEDTEVFTDFCANKYSGRIYALFTDRDVYSVGPGDYPAGGDDG